MFILWDSYGVLMFILWDSYGVLMFILWDSYGVLTWFYGVLVYNHIIRPFLRKRVTLVTFCAVRTPF